MTDDAVVYRSHVEIERLQGALRRAHLPAEEEPTYFGVHSQILEHYGVEAAEHEERAATLDYFVAAVAG